MTYASAIKLPSYYTSILFLPSFLLHKELLLFIEPEETLTNLPEQAVPFLI